MDALLNPSPPGTLILEGIVGSTAYGLAHPDSDIDRLGVYVAPIDTVLGLDGPTATGGKKATTVTHNPDRTCHEIGKYLGLALQCNPTVMELLWLPQWETRTVAGALLVQLRQAVLHTSRVRAAYGGYAVEQAKRLTRRSGEGKPGFAADQPRPAKHGRHCARLLLMGQWLLEHGELMVDVGFYRTELFEVGEMAAAANPAAFLRYFERAKRRLDEVESVLPDRPDRKLVNDTLVEIRRGLQ